MRILHILVQLSNLIAAIGALNIISKDISMPSNFSYKSVPSTLQHQADAKVWIIFLFLQTGFNQPCFKCNITRLLFGQFLTHRFLQTNFTYN